LGTLKLKGATEPVQIEKQLFYAESRTLAGNCALGAGNGAHSRVIF
jgi:hypothetical protein